VIAGGREFLSKSCVPIVAEYNLESIRDANRTPAAFLGMLRELGYDVYRMPRPWVGGYRWESLKRVHDERELPELCDIVLSKFDPAGTTRAH
jgi:hypothetical protein